MVVEEEPPRPSAATGALPDRRRLKGDLDSIVLKAMSKESSRRYASAQELSEDISRHLTGRPVIAREPSLGYVVRRLAARHRAAFLSASVSLVVIVAALFLAIRQARVATAERDRARIEATKARQVSAFLRTLFSAAYPRNQIRGTKPSAQDLLDRGAARVDPELGGQPDLQASMLALLSSVYTEMGLYRQALPLGERSLALREELFGPEHLDVAESLYTLGRMKRLQSEHEAAEPLLKRAVAIREKHGGPEDPLLAEALAELGNVLYLRGRYDDARACLERAVAIEEKAGGPQLARWLTALSNLDYAAGDFDSQQRRLERALDVGIRTEGRAGYLVSVTVLNLGLLMREQEDYPRAQALLERALEIAEELYGTEHQALVFNWGELGDLYLAMGDHERAREFLTRSITVGEKILGPEHLGLAPPLSYSGRLLLAEGRPQEALSLFERELRLREKGAALDRDIALNLVEIAGVRTRLGETAEAERLLRRALAMQREALVPGHRSLVPTLTALGELLSARHEDGEALSLLQEAVAIARAKLPAHHSQRAQAEAALALHARP
jgi:tetratricopeptide (TPR) repeat protein